MGRMFAALSMSAALILATATGAMAQTSEEPGGGSSGGSHGTAPDEGPRWWIDVSVVAVGGNEAGRLEAGRPAEITVRASNNSGEAAKDVDIALAPSKGTETSTDRLSFGDIASGAHSDVTITAEASEAGCEGFAPLNGTLSSSLGKQDVSFGVTVACPGARLAQETVEYVGGDGDGVPEAGERLKVFVTYHNHGRDPATDVRANVVMRSKDVELVDATAAWGTIAPGTSVRATDPFEIQVSPDAQPQDPGCDAGPTEPMIVEEEGAAPPPDEGQAPAAEGGASAPDDGKGDKSTTDDGKDGSSDETVSNEQPQDGVQPEPDRPDERRGHEPGVALTGEMEIEWRGGSSNDSFSTEMYCIALESGRGEAPTGAPVDDGATNAKDLLAGSKGAARDSGRTGALWSAGLLLAAVGSMLGNRLVAGRR